MKQIRALTVDASIAIIALCISIAENDPQKYSPIDPITGNYVDYIYVDIPKDADEIDFTNLRWLKDHPRKGVVLKYERMYLRSPMEFS